MTTNLVHNGGQRISSPQYPTFTWQSAGSWSNSYGEIRSYDNTTDRDTWENVQKLDITHNSITYYIAYKPNNASHDAQEWPSLNSISGVIHIQNGTTVDWWDRYISFSNIGTTLSNSNNGTYPSSSSGWATSTSSSHTAASGTQSHNYVQDALRSIHCEKTAAYQIKWTFEESDFSFVGDIGYVVRKNGSTSDELDYTFVSTDGSIEMVITSATQYPNSQIDTGDVITLHSDTNVQTQDSDGNFTYKTAGTILGSFTYTAIDVGYTLSPASPKCLDPVTIQVSDTALFPDYQNDIVLSYTLDSVPAGYPGGSSSNMSSITFGSTTTLNPTNTYSLTGTFTASYDGSSLTGLPGTLRVYRKTPAPANAQILLGQHSIPLKGNRRRAHSFW